MYILLGKVVLLICTLFFSGLLLRVPLFDKPNNHELYDDRVFWNISEEGFPKGEEVGDEQTGYISLFVLENYTYYHKIRS